MFAGFLKSRQPSVLSILLLSPPLLVAIFPALAKCRNGPEDSRTAFIVSFDKERPEADRIIRADGVLEAIKQGKEVRIQNAVIEGDLDLTILPFQKPNNRGFITRRVRDWLQSQEIDEIRLVRGAIFIKDSIIKGGIQAIDSPNDNAKPLIFAEVVWLSDTTVIGELNFGNTVFSGGLVLNGSWLNDNCLFCYAQFHQQQFSTSFEQVVFSKDVDLDHACFSTDVRFNGAKFNSLSLSQAKFAGQAFFYGTEFRGRLDFSRNELLDLVQFDKSKCFARANFDGTQFHDDVRFWRFETSRGTVTTFDRSKFLQRVGFTEAKMMGTTYFERTEFLGPVHFGAVRFGGDTSFRDTIFSKEADFRKASFNGFTNFDGAEFDQRVDLREAFFERAVFNYTSSPVSIAAPIDFRGVHALKAYFVDISFENRVDFSGAVFGRSEVGQKDKFQTDKAEETEKTPDIAAFKNVHFQSDVDFLESQFNCGVLFRYTKFGQRADFTDAQFRQEIIISHLDFRTLNIEWLQISQRLISLEDRGEPALILSSKERVESKEEGELPPDVPSEKKAEPLYRIYEKFEKYFRDQKRYVEANRTYWEYKGIEFRRKNDEARLYQKPLVVLTSVFPWAYLSMGITSQFGTDLKLVILWTMGLCLISAFAYMLFGQKSFTMIVKDRQVRMRLAETPVLSYAEQELPQDRQYKRGNRLRHFLFCLAFSVNNFLKIGYGNTRIKASRASKALKILVWAQWLLGHGWYILILYTTLNTVPALKSLLF